MRQANNETKENIHYFEQNPVVRLILESPVSFYFLYSLQRDESFNNTIESLSRSFNSFNLDKSLSSIIKGDEVEERKEVKEKRRRGEEEEEAKGRRGEEEEEKKEVNQDFLVGDRIQYEN